MPKSNRTMAAMTIGAAPTVAAETPTMVIPTAHCWTAVRGGTRVFNGPYVDEIRTPGNPGRMGSPQAALTCVVIGRSHDLI
jgi:hypothetical protein